MSPPREPERATDLVLLGFGFAVLLLASRLREFWATDAAPWWTPFVPWALTIVVAALVTRAWIRHGD